MNRYHFSTVICKKNKTKKKHEKYSSEYKKPKNNIIFLFFVSIV